MTVVILYKNALLPQVRASSAGKTCDLGDQEWQMLGVARGSDHHAPVAAGLSGDGDGTTVRVKSARNICRALWLPRGVPNYPPAGPHAVRPA